MRGLADTDNYIPAHHVYCITVESGLNCLQLHESLLFLRWPISLCFRLELESHHRDPQMAGPVVSGGIPQLKGDLTVNSLHASPITGKTTPGLDNMQLVFVYRAQAKCGARSRKIQFKGSRQGRPDSLLQLTSFVLHLLCEIGILLTCWKAAENREKGAMHFFSISLPTDLAIRTCNWCTKAAWFDLWNRVDPPHWSVLTILLLLQEIFTLWQQQKMLKGAKCFHHRNNA